MQTYRRAELAALLSPHRVPLAWTDEPDWAGRLEFEAVKAVSNQAVIELELARNPNADADRLEMAMAAEKQIANVMVLLMSPAVRAA